MTGADVALSLTLYVLVYLLIFPSGLAVMWRIVRRGFVAEEEQTPVAAGRTARPTEALSGEAGEG